jgi:hypothetical protein
MIVVLHSIVVKALLELKTMSHQTVVLHYCYAMNETLGYQYNPSKDVLTQRLASLDSSNLY